MVTPQRGDIYWAAFDPTVGTEIRKKRPAVIISNNTSNLKYFQVTVIPLTSQNTKAVEPFQAFVSAKESGLKKDSRALAEQMRTISKLRLGTRIGQLTPETLTSLEAAIKIHLDLK